MHKNLDDILQQHRGHVAVFTIQGCRCFTLEVPHPLAVRSVCVVCSKKIFLLKIRLFLKTVNSYIHWSLDLLSICTLQLATQSVIVT